MRSIVVIRSGLIFGIIVGFLILAGVVSAATPVSGCTNINSPGVYELQNDIPNSSVWRCINITSSDVIFDGQGHTIDGIGPPSQGIRVYNSATILTNITVTNLTVTDWGYGILYLSVKNGGITNSTASSNKYGIYLRYSNYTSITGNNVSNSTSDGITLYSSSNNTITGNNAFENNYDGGGILLVSSSSNTITGNNASDNVYEGISLYSPSRSNIIKDNIVMNNGLSGIYIRYSNSSNITGNTASNNDLSGIYIKYSNSSNITGNIVLNNDLRGIYIESSNSSNITNNTVSNNKMDGIFLKYSSSNTITNNNASYSNASYSNASSDTILCNGIGISHGDNNLIDNNTVESNLNNGIWLGNSYNNTVSNNHFKSNGGSGWQDSGIYLYKSQENNITNNNASGNIRGFYLNSSSNNTIYNNFLNNTDNTYDNGNNSWNTTKTVGTNIVGGPYIGGNLWAKPDGTGFSQTCTDMDDDGICDSNYTLPSGNVDYLPLKYLPIHNLNTSLSYSTIQEAIDAAETKTGHTIQVDAGTYTENVDVNKSLNIIGAGFYVTSVNASATNDHVFDITANSVNISGFSIKDATGGGKAAIYIENVRYSNISKVTVSNNSIGIYLLRSSNNTISSNVIFDNTWGAYLNGSSNNTGNLIYNNYFFNTNNSYDNGTNDWNTTNSTGPNIAGGPYLGGNLWSDYIGDDNDSDGFGDTPYNISGGSGIDYLPLVDTTPPNITINSPINGTTFNTGSIDFDITVSEPINVNASVLVYYLDVNTSPLQILLENDLQNPYRWYNDTITLADYGYGEGGYNATFNVTDLSGNSNSSTVYFSVDTTPPNVTIYSPGNNTYPTDLVDLNYTVTDNSGKIYWVGYGLDGAANVTLYGNTTLSIPNGQHSLTVYASDTAGNTNSSTTVYFFVDDSILDMFVVNINTTVNNVTTGEFTDTYASKYVDIELSTGNRSVSGYINVTVHEDTPFSINPLNSNYGLGSGRSQAGMFVKFKPGSTLDSNSGSLKWVMFKLNYTSIDLSALVENSLRFYWYDTSGGNWVKLTEGLNLSPSGGPEVYGMGINTSGKYVWVNLSNFSVYGLAADVSTQSLTEEEKHWHRLGIGKIMPLVGVVIPGTEARFSVVINNLGDFVERGVRISIINLPKGWTIEDIVTDVGYKEKVRVIFPVSVPADAKKGTIALTFKVMPGDFIANVEKQVSIVVDKAPPLAADIPVMSVPQNITAPTAAPHGIEATKGVGPVTPPFPGKKESLYRKITLFGPIVLLILIIMARLKRKLS